VPAFGAGRQVNLAYKVTTQDSLLPPGAGDEAVRSFEAHPRHLAIIEGQA